MFGQLLNLRTWLALVAVAIVTTRDHDDDLVVPQDLAGGVEGIHVIGLGDAAVEREVDHPDVVRGLVVEDPLQRFDHVRGAGPEGQCVETTAAPA